MPAVLFVCVANSARSQLAEAIARHLRPDLDVVSAGSAPTRVRPQVPEVLREVGIDAYGLRAKSLFEIPFDEITVAVTLCSEAQCPVLPRAVRHISWPLPDPASAPDHEALEAFRATRDELMRRIPPLLDEVAPPPRRR